MMVREAFSRAWVRQVGWNAIVLLLLTGARCESSQDEVDAGPDATETSDAGADGGGHACTERIDGGAVADLAPGEDGGAGDGGAAWYDEAPCDPALDDSCSAEGEKCLSSADDCAVLHGTVGDTACVRIGMEGGIRGDPRPPVELVGDCVTLLAVDDSAPVMPGCGEDCHYWIHHLYELVEAGECAVEVRPDPGQTWHSPFDIHFRVESPAQ
jgi:hypothetical protein